MKKKETLCLAIDTTTDDTTVACSNLTSYIVVQKNTSHEQGEILMDMIQRALNGINKKATDLTLIAVTVGPGSFTGVRIGLATAKALGLALNCPVVGVDNFTASAYQLEQPVKVVLDSKRDDYFTQDFDAKGKAKGAPTIKAAKNLKKEMPFTACGSGAQKLSQEIKCHNCKMTYPLALSAAQIALTQPKKTCPAQPLYLREADVTLPRH